MRGVLVKYEDDNVVVTNDFEQWLYENNLKRDIDGEEPESEHDFSLTEVEIKIL